MNYAPQMPKQDIRVAKMILMESGTYNPIYSRPYSTYVDSAALDNITRRIDSANGGVITGSLLSGIASSILTPSATPQGEISIPYGWTERRIRFLLEVHITTNTGSSFIYYIQGYTSHLGVTPNGTIDPHMEFIINSLVRVSRNQQYGLFGLQIKDTITESAHIINGTLVHQATQSDVYTMRPQDIFTGIQTNYLNSAYSYHNDGNSLHDTRIKVNNESIRSSRSNNLPSHFIAKVVDDYQTGIKLSEFGQQDQDIIGRCRGLAHEASVYENIFIRALSNVSGIPNRTTFTFAELQKIDYNLPNVTNYVALGATQLAVQHQTGQTAYWNSTDRETHVATILSNSVPAVMMDNMFSKIHFRSTNHDSAGLMNTIFIDGKSLTNMDLTSSFELFKRRIEREILFDITYSNQDLYMLEMKADLFGDTVITLSMGNGPMVTYTTPSFCDSLLTPVMTTNKENFFGVVHDFEVLMNNVNQSGSGAMSLNTNI